MVSFKSLYRMLVVFLLTALFSSSAFAFSFDSFLNFFQSKDKKVVKHSVAHAPNVKPPMHVKVGVYVLHVGKYDLQGANYQMDFYLIFKCQPTCANVNFEIMNATNVNAQQVANQAGTLVYRVRADLNKANNLRNYPFDSHTLDIVIEDRHLTSDKIIFEVDPITTALDPQLNVVGFVLSPTWLATVSDHYYKVFQRTSSSYKFTISIQRPVLAGFLKGILPALIIVCCNFLALFIRVDHISQRLSVATSTLIAAGVFHLNLTNSIPPLGYITFADMFMFINYLCLFIVLIEVVATMYFMETKHKVMAIKLNTESAWAIPAIWLVLQMFNWIAYNPADFFGG